MQKNSFGIVVLIAAAAGMFAATAGAGSHALSKAKVPAQAPAAALPLPPQDSSALPPVPPAPSLFSFRVVTEPESAAVLLDDSAKGYSPCSLSGVPAGVHVLTLKKNGYYLKKAEITVDSASAPELSFSLLKPAFLRVTSNPAGAALFMDGEKQGSTPYENDKVKPGDHSFKVELRQYAPAERTLTVKNGGCDTVHFVLEHTKAYRDSVETALQAAEKLRKERFNFSLVSAIVCLAAVFLVVLEANSQ